MTAVGILPIVAATILRKAARDEGFDIELGEDAGWLRFESTQTPGAIALTAVGAVWVFALSLSPVAAELAREAESQVGPLPTGMTAAFACPNIGTLYHLLARSRMLGRSLPAVPLARFVEESKVLPRSTEAERLVVQRVGQDIFRQALLDYWDGRCPLTGIDDPRLLRASHMKPWAACETDAERLDVHNGLLLAVHFDAAFDAGLITFDSEGGLVTSCAISEENAERLGLSRAPPLRLSAAHAPFLDWHSKNVFVSS